MNEKSLKSYKMNKVYQNPTIAEALCELHFECNPSSYPDIETILRSLKAELGSDYPSVTEQQLKQYRAEITDRGVSVDESKSNTTRLIFKHKERNHLLQLLPNILTINEVGKYPSWKVFLQDVLRGWAALNAVMPSIKPRRVGLRYINLIPRRNIAEPLSAWLKPNKYYPSGILDNTTGFLSRNEIDLNQDHRVILTLSEPIQKEAQVQVIFDIDVISAISEEENNEVNDLCERLEILHNIAWDVFSTSLSEKYEALLNGELI